MASVRLQLSPSFVVPSKVEAPGAGWLSRCRSCDRAALEQKELRKRSTQLAAESNDKTASRAAAG